jgi:hypothetical protein
MVTHLGKWHGIRTWRQLGALVTCTTLLLAATATAMLPQRDPKPVAPFPATVRRLDLAYWKHERQTVRIRPGPFIVPPSRANMSFARLLS